MFNNNNHNSTAVFNPKLRATSKTNKTFRTTCTGLLKKRSKHILNKLNRKPRRTESPVEYLTINQSRDGTDCVFGGSKS